MLLNFKRYQLILIVIILPFGALALDKVGTDKRRPDSPIPLNWHSSIVGRILDSVDGSETLTDKLLEFDSKVFSEFLVDNEKESHTVTPSLREIMIQRFDKQPSKERIIKTSKALRSWATSKRMSK